MRKSLLALWIFIASLYPAPAQMMQDIVNSKVSVATCTAYTGLGDVVSGAKMWFGLRAYNCTYAAALSKAIQIRRASDSTTQDIAVTATGPLNIASANSFAGTQATCSGTISSTTATLTSCSATPVAGDTLTGTGIVGPSYVASCGTFTGGAGSCTLNAAQTVGSPVTITFQVGMFIAKWYDQSGASFCSGACDISISTGASQYQLLPNCIGALPCALMSGQSFPGNTPAFSSIAAPWSIEVVANETVNSAVSFISDNNNETISKGSGNNWLGGVTGGVTSNVAANDNVFHGATFATTTSSGIINVDGGTGSGTFTTPTFATPLFLGNATGFMTEMGVWPSTFSSGNQTSLCHNQYINWNSSFGTAC